MRVFIEIDCENEDEIYSHLEAIKETIVRKFETEIDIDLPYFKSVKFSDENCYGYHNVEIHDTENNNPDN